MASFISAALLLSSKSIISLVIKEQEIVEYIIKELKYSKIYI